MSVLLMCDGNSRDGTCFDQSSVFGDEVVYWADTLLIRLELDAFLFGRWRLILLVLVVIFSPVSSLHFHTGLMIVFFWTVFCCTLLFIYYSFFSYYYSLRIIIIIIVLLLIFLRKKMNKFLILRRICLVWGLLWSDNFNVDHMVRHNRHVYPPNLGSQ